MDSFLEEQLKRIQELSERMSQLQNRAAELNQEMERDREALRHGPLQNAKDLRTYSGQVQRSDAADRPARRRRRR
jgi:lipid II:glycine glycyltransferase (peptidoglycan interpeptide bridge formation enzyme)